MTSKADAREASQTRDALAVAITRAIFMDELTADDVDELIAAIWFKQNEGQMDEQKAKSLEWKEIEREQCTCPSIQDMVHTKGCPLLKVMQRY